jgi:hypothetical protein
MKNPESKPLRIKWKRHRPSAGDDQQALVLATLAVAESNLVRAGKDSALPHFIALVKAIEEIYDFTFEKLEEPNES